MYKDWRGMFDVSVQPQPDVSKNIEHSQRSKKKATIFDSRAHVLRLDFGFFLLSNLDLW